MDKFKIGDLVYHLSKPDQRMIIVVAHTAPMYKCRWITVNGEVHLYKFFEEELETWKMRNGVRK